jgi:hypothetical protein
VQIDVPFLSRIISKDEILHLMFDAKAKFDWVQNVSKSLIHQMDTRNCVECVTDQIECSF